MVNWASDWLTVSFESSLWTEPVMGKNKYFWFSQLLRQSEIFVFYSPLFWTGLQKSITCSPLGKGKRGLLDVVISSMWWSEFLTPSCNCFCLAPCVKPGQEQLWLECASMMWSRGKSPHHWIPSFSWQKKKSKGKNHPHCEQNLTNKYSVGLKVLPVPRNTTILPVCLLCDITS